VQFSATHLVLEERVLDITRHFGHGQNVTLRFLVPLDTDAIAQHGAFIPDQLEGAGRELARSGGGVGLGHLLEQFCPLFLLAVTLECIVTILREAQCIQPCQNRIEFILHRRRSLFKRQLVPGGVYCIVVPRGVSGACQKTT
jgi:hypothetical protein